MSFNVQNIDTMSSTENYALQDELPFICVKERIDSKAFNIFFSLEKMVIYAGNSKIDIGLHRISYMTLAIKYIQYNSYFFFSSTNLPTICIHKVFVKLCLSIVRFPKSASLTKPQLTKK